MSAAQAGFGMLQASADGAKEVEVSIFKALGSASPEVLGKNPTQLAAPFEPKTPNLKGLMESFDSMDKRKQSFLSSEPDEFIRTASV